MKQKGFIFIFLLIWNISTFSGNMSVSMNQQSDILPAASHLYFSLGCRAVVPCQDYSHDSDSLKWFFKKDERSNQIQIFFRDKNGVQHRHISGPKGSIGPNDSFVISSFTKDDEGMYWCETCQQKCHQSTVIIVKKEMWIHETFYIIAGSSFEHACSGKLSNVKWTFEATTALRKSGLRAETDIVTFNKSIHIGNVRREDAGKYTCWTSSCHEGSMKLLTINLCVVTVHDSKDSSASCAGMCDMKSSNPNGTSVIYPYGSPNCSADSGFDGYSTVTTSRVPSNTFSKTTGVQKHPEHWMTVIYGISVSCVILMALLIFYFRSRLRSGGRRDINGLLITCHQDTCQKNN